MLSRAAGRVARSEKLLKVLRNLQPGPLPIGITNAVGDPPVLKKHSLGRLCL